MRKTLLLTVLLSIALFTNAQKKAQLYAVKEGYIKYEVKGNSTGTEEMWWTDYGFKTRKLTKVVTVTKIFGIKKKEEKHTLEIINKDKVYYMDHIQKKNVVTTMPYRPITEDMTEAEKEKISNDALDILGGERLGKEKLRGYTCEKIKVLGIVSWIYKGITLKSKGKLLGNELDQDFTEFKPNEKIDTLLFEPPEGVKFDSVPQPQDVIEMPEYKEEDNPEQGENEKDEVNNNASIKYPFNLFEEKLSGFKEKGYIKTPADKKGGEYSVSFGKIFPPSSIMVIVTTENLDKQKSMGEKFTHNGKTCYYLTKGRQTSILLIEIPKYDVIATITFMPGKDKAKMLKIADQFNF